MDMESIITSSVVVERVMNSFVFKSRVSYEFWLGLLVLSVVVYCLWTLVLSHYFNHKNHYNNSSNSNNNENNNYNYFYSQQSHFSNRKGFFYKQKMKGKIQKVNKQTIARNNNNRIVNEKNDDKNMNNNDDSFGYTNEQNPVQDKKNSPYKRKVSFDLVPLLCSIDTQLPPSNRKVVLSLNSNEINANTLIAQNELVMAQLGKIGIEIKCKHGNNENKIDMKFCVLLALLLYRRSIFLSQGINLYSEYFSVPKKIDEELRMRSCSFDEKETPMILKEIALEHRLKEELPHIRNIFPCCLEDFLSMNITASFSLGVVIRLESKRFINNVGKSMNNSDKFLALLENKKVIENLQIIHSSNVFNTS